jgi:hypothetical protein
MKPDRVLAIHVVAAVAIATFVRLHFGIDFSDESYYIAMARRFALGDRPLIRSVSRMDERAAHGGGTAARGGQPTAHPLGRP